MKNTFVLLYLLIGFSALTAETINNKEFHIDKNTTVVDVLKHINKNDSDWFYRDILVKEPFILNTETITNTRFLLSEDDPMGGDYYEIIFYSKDIFIFGSNFWGATINVIGNYEIIDKGISLYNYYIVNDSDKIPGFFRNKQKALLTFERINHLYTTYGLVESSFSKPFVMAGIAPEINSEVSIGGVPARKLNKKGVLVKNTPGYIKPLEGKQFKINGELFFDEIQGKELTDSDDLIFYKGTDVEVLAENKSHDGTFYYCILPVLHEYYTSIRFWIKKENVLIQ